MRPAGSDRAHSERAGPAGLAGITARSWTGAGRSSARVVPPRYDAGPTPTASTTGGAAGRCGVHGRGIPLGDFWETCTSVLAARYTRKAGAKRRGLRSAPAHGADSDATRAHLTPQALTAIQSRAAGSHRCPRWFLVTVLGAQDVGDVLRAHAVEMEMEPLRAGHMGPAGHLAVFCNAAPSCRPVWYRPRHEPISGLLPLLQRAAGSVPRRAP
jgi:hypothetical protein